MTLVLAGATYAPGTVWAAPPQDTSGQPTATASPTTGGAEKADETSPSESGSGAPSPSTAPTSASDASNGSGGAAADDAGDLGPAPAPNPAGDENADTNADADPTEGEPEADSEREVSAPADSDAPRPPRIDGAFVGGTLGVGMTFTRVNDLSTPSPMIGPVGLVSAGDAVFPWLTIGVSFYGGGGFAGDQRVGHGGLLLDVGLLPAPKRAPFSFRLGAGFGAGAVRDANETPRFGFGGALFRGGVRYEFFPTAAKRRPNRGGGWSIGPELTWLGETPAAAGRPMANTILLGLWTGFYFGS